MIYHFDNPDRPTEFNIAKQLRASGFEYSNHNGNCDFSDQHLHLDTTACEQLEYKDQLAKLCAQYCPSIIPPSFTIDYQSAACIAKQLPNGCRWILKPALMNNGEGIVLCETRQAIIEHFASNRCYDGPHIVQQYIEPPHLLQGHKYSLRLFIVLTNAKSSYLYPHGYFNVCKQPYTASDLTKIHAHLTNEHLSMAEHADSIQIPTSRAPHFDSIFFELQRITQQLLQAHQSANPEFYQSVDVNALSLFGLDFMLDAKLRAWLLEVNHGPCFPVEPNHILQSHLYDGFWQCLNQEIVLPIANRQAIKTKTFIELT